MAFALTSSKYSLIDFGTPDYSQCSPYINICMPMLESGDIAFQVIVAVTGADKDTFQVLIEGEDDDPDTIWTIQGKVCSDCDDNTNVGPNAFGYIADAGGWTKIVTGAGADPDIWVGNFAFNGNSAYFDGLDSGDCFNLCFHLVLIDVEDATVILTQGAFIDCTATCFQKIDDPCFTSVFQYRCNEDAFEFYYSGNAFVNQVRIPAYLRDMQLPSEEKSYQKSDGSYIKLFERIDEEYELNIDWLPKSGHQKLKVMLAHDVLKINNTNEVITSTSTLTQIVCREKYEINWPAHPWQHAPAKTRVRLATPLKLLNSNCQ